MTDLLNRMKIIQLSELIVDHPLTLKNEYIT